MLRSNMCTSIHINAICEIIHIRERNYYIFGKLSHKNRSQELRTPKNYHESHSPRLQTCKIWIFSFGWILLLQRILDHAIIVQPCRSLDHLQKDNKDRQGPGERNQILPNNYDEPLISNFRPVHWTVFRISTEKSWSLPIIRSTFVHFWK